ncbi:MAG: hypothetical protein HUJ94_04245, partial [Bacteroidales bacterium]|nr:hypothetical protein [Bacteroidales bacterium]
NVGEGNELPEGIITGAPGEVIVKNFTDPTGNIVTNQWNYISAFTPELTEFTFNYTKTSKGFIVEAGKEATITATSGKAVLSFFALGVNGSPTLQLVRSSGKAIPGKSSDNGYIKSSDENPFTVAKHESATKTQNNFIVSGNGQYHKFNLRPMNQFADNTAAGETISFKVTGNPGEKVIIFGINLSSYRDDEQ